MSYPAGVTGAEYEIAGAEREMEENRACSDEDCGFVGLVAIEVWNSTETWTCPKCGRGHAEYVGEDPDEYAEEE
jgi:hypothetical protein